MGDSGACPLACRCPDTPCLALTAAAGQPQAAGNRGLVAAQCGFCGYFGFLWPCGSLGGAGASSVQQVSARSHQGGYYHPRAGWYSALVLGPPWARPTAPHTAICAQNHPTTNPLRREISLESRQKSQMPLEFRLLDLISEVPDLEMPLAPTLANS